MDLNILQKQLRDNAADLAEYSRDLKSWGNEMKRKEISLTHKQDPSSEKQRKSVIKSFNKNRCKTGATDYNSWEKFDVEAELNRLDGDVEDESELSDEIDNKARDEALVQKEKGNKFVQDKKWDQAILCYTSAIKAFAYDPVFYANRALCYLKIEQYIKAEDDCTFSLKLDKTYVKALQRRAAAREKLNKFGEAKVDLENVLLLEPKNNETKQVLERIKKKFGKFEETSSEQRPVSKFSASRNKIQQNFKSGSSNLENSNTPDDITKTEQEQSKIENISKLQTKCAHGSWPHFDDIILINPVSKPPHLRSTKPLKRVQIDEIKEYDKNENHDGQKIEKIMPTLIDHDSPIKHEIIEKTMIFDVETIKEKRSMFKRKREQGTSEQNVKTSEVRPQSNQDYVSLKSDDLKVIERKDSENLKDIKNTCNISLTNSGKNLVEHLDNPKNSVQFYSAWRNLRSPSEQYIFLKRIKPTDIPDIFKESLDSNVFSSILNLLATEFFKQKDETYEYLVNFTRVKRFSALVMFMNSTDKRNLWKLIIGIRETENKSKVDVDYLIESYEL
ncbi:RNA polymerase II-associated protein 3 isoform X2 [Cylas formicarius]|uniref:RNA polymerase II-associated protein 3 isoform X2 n=1 Tax=Cylas formicarius TaxID=197179 RepID=UPI00295875AC|nr:RNA polymerase II-associated protein 3 isoform X2 [Cylas formicarius]